MLAHAYARSGREALVPQQKVGSLTEGMTCQCLHHACTTSGCLVVLVTMSFAAPVLREEVYIPMRFTAAEVGALPSCFTLDAMMQDVKSRR